MFPVQYSIFINPKLINCTAAIFLYSVVHVVTWISFTYNTWRFCINEFYKLFCIGHWKILVILTTVRLFDIEHDTKASSVINEWWSCRNIASYFPRMDFDGIFKWFLLRYFYELKIIRLSRKLGANWQNSIVIL